MSATYRLKGGKELQAAFRELTESLQTSVLERSLIEAAKPMVETAQAMVPEDEGILVKSIRASKRLTPRQRRLAGPKTVDARVFVGAGPDPAAHLVEYGSIHNPQPTPFMRSAFESHKQDVINRLVPAVWKELRKASDRLVKKYFGKQGRK